MQGNENMKALVVIGTRPECIKLAPVINELRKRACDAPISVKVCVTAQHREMLDQMLRLFDIVPDYDLDVMQANQSPEQVVSTIISKFGAVLREEKPDWVIVQGDTSTVVAASLAAFYNRVKVAHVEAGLRSHDRWQPYPEEINRRVAGVVADLHFAPTEHSRQNLLAEQVPHDSIIVTGNSVIDAVHWIASQPRKSDELLLDDDEKLILVTAHRRENFGEPLENICFALRDIAARNRGRGVRIIYAVHPNPRVTQTVHTILSDCPDVVLTGHLEYSELVHLMRSAYLVLTDSGGIQEEAPSFGKPVLVMRNVTERPEGIEAGVVKLVGSDRCAIVSEVTKLLDDPEEYSRMSRQVNPYGDGKASTRIVAGLLGEAVEQFAPAESEAAKVSLV